MYTLDGRQFRAESDYLLAKRDKKVIDALREQTDFGDRGQLEALCRDLRGGKYHFQTLLGRDFRDEAEAALKKLVRGDGGRAAESASRGKRQSQPGDRGAAKARNKPFSGQENAEMDEIVLRELRKRERCRKLLLAACSVAAACCLGYFGLYSYYNARTRRNYEQMIEWKEKAAANSASAPSVAADPLFTLDGKPPAREVLEEYQNMLLANRKLIGWVKIDGTNIDYPVMQTEDNQYYLDHNLNQEYDQNGAIFLDKDCDVLKPSTNFILYGHHMKNGQMFGKLDLYQKESYYQEHPSILFDTIYEKGIYQILYVFRSKVYKETEIAFKYYQFIDAYSEQEFNSYMREMEALSFYDTGVTAEYGDQLLTLSTCDERETDGRFVVVAKKVEK